MTLSILYKIELNPLKFRGFRFRAKEDKKCHNCLFSIVLNSSLPLVFCTVQNTFLAKKKKRRKNATQNERMKHARWTIEIVVFWKTVHRLSYALQYNMYIVFFFFSFFLFFTFVYFPRLWLVDFLFNIPMNKTNIVGVGANFYDNGNARVKLTLSLLQSKSSKPHLKCLSVFISVSMSFCDRLHVLA